MINWQPLSLGRLFETHFFRNSRTVNKSIFDKFQIEKLFQDSHELLTMRKAEFLDALSTSIYIQTINELLYKIYLKN